MQIFWAFLPLFAFFASYRLAGIYVATGVLIGAAVLQLLWHRWRAGEFKTLHLLVAGLAIVLGGATLLLHDQRYIQWKPTVLFWILALAFLGSQFIGRRTLVERLFESTTELKFTLDPRQWRIMNFIWFVFYALLGALNLYVKDHFTQDTWVTFKAFGLLLLMLIFILPQAVWLAARAQETPGESTQPPEHSP
jgi:intracellular septation protein